MDQIKIVLAAMIVIGAQITIAFAQSSPEIELVTAAIAKTPENELLYIDRGWLYTWKGKYIGPNIAYADIGKSIDENRMKALADADSAIRVSPRSYKAYAFRASLLESIGSSYSGRLTYKEDLETAARLRNESNIVARILKFDVSGGRMISPPYTESVPVLNVFVKGDKKGRPDGFVTLIAAKDHAKKEKQPRVIMFNKDSKKFYLYDTFITENVWPNVSLAETPFNKALKGKSPLPLTYEALKIEPEYSVQPMPTHRALDNDKLPWQFIDILDARGLSLLKDAKLPLLRGSKGLRLLFDDELNKGNFDEALAIYEWLAAMNAKSVDLDVVKVTRKTNLTKLYRGTDKLKAFVEKEMTKWNYADDEKKAVRGN